MSNILIVELDGLPREGVPCMVKVTIEMDGLQLLLIALALAKLVLTATR
ncbi:MAG TPA: hypothetical protein VNT26_13880 [Candidatus Sulfotelmatobacter sp.]|nr:hypothetical protein [Candidatus Sulfotelmatobacter sp.]